MMMMMNCFCVMVDLQKAFSLISSWDHCQRSSTWRISDMPQAGFEHVQNLSSGLVDRRCAVVIIITPRRYVTFLSFLCICNERTLSTFVDASLSRYLKYIFPENFNSLSEKLIILWLKIIFLNFPNVCNTASYFWTCLFIVLTETSC